MPVDVGIKGGLITYGLGRPACKGIITMSPFQLACFIKVVKPPSTPGGSIPLAPGEIHGFYKPVDPDSFGKLPTEGEFVDPKVYGKRKVLIKITSEYFKGEKEYLVPINRVKVIVKVINIVNKTITHLRVGITNFKQLATKAKIIIKNLKWKRKE